MVWRPSRIAWLVFSAALCSTPAAKAQTVISGFGNGTGFAFNSNGTLPLITNGVLLITDGGLGESRSVFFNTRLGIDSFTAQFTFQASGSFLADGIAFVLQNDSRGASALGDGGSGLGYGGIAPSAAYEINIYSGHVIGGTLATNGAYGTYDPTGNVSFTSGNPIRVTLAYNGTLLSTTLLDLTTNQTFQTSYTVNLSNVLGGHTAYVGFTGATGALTSTQTISNFTFTSIPEPTSVALMCLGLIGVGLVEGRRRLAIRRVREQRA